MHRGGSLTLGLGALWGWSGLLADGQGGITSTSECSLIHRTTPLFYEEGRKGGSVYERQIVGRVLNRTVLGGEYQDLDTAIGVLSIVRALWPWAASGCLSWLCLSLHSLGCAGGRCESELHWGFTTIVHRVIDRDDLTLLCHGSSGRKLGVVHLRGGTSGSRRGHWEVIMADIRGRVGIISMWRRRIFMIGGTTGKIGISTIVESLLLVIGRSVSGGEGQRRGGSSSGSVRVVECRLSDITGLRVVTESIVAHVAVRSGAVDGRSPTFAHGRRGSDPGWRWSIVVWDHGRMAHERVAVEGLLVDIVVLVSAAHEPDNKGGDDGNTDNSSSSNSSHSTDAHSGGIVAIGSRRSRAGGACGDPGDGGARGSVSNGSGSAGAGVSCSGWSRWDSRHRSRCRDRGP